MEEMISFCGLGCHACPAFLATQADDDEKRAEVAKLWSKEFNADIQTTDINCEGCHSDGDILFGHCRVCGIRKCGLEKTIPNCAHCDDYACEKLDMIFKMAPDAKKQLDEIQQSL